jgi:hypothetical protein
MKAIMASVIVLLATVSAARADDEIQIYNAQIAAVGHGPLSSISITRSTAAKRRTFSAASFQTMR